MGKCLTLQGLHASFQHLTYLYRLENRKAGLLGGGEGLDLVRKIDTPCKINMVHLMFSSVFSH